MAGGGMATQCTRLTRAVPSSRRMSGTTAYHVMGLASLRKAWHPVLGLCDARYGHNEASHRGVVRRLMRDGLDDQVMRPYPRRGEHRVCVCARTRVELTAQMSASSRVREDKERRRGGEEGQ